jgi:hypothetical protein
LNKITSKRTLYNKYLVKKLVYQHNKCRKHKTIRVYMTIRYAEENTYHRIVFLGQKDLFG